MATSNRHRSEHRQTLLTSYRTTAELADVLRAPVDTVRYWRHVGKGPKFFKIGRRVLYDNDDVRDWIAEQKAASVDRGES